MAQISNHDNNNNNKEEKDGYTIRLLCGNSNKELAKGIANQLGIEVEPCKVEQFADGEIDIHIQNNVRGSDMYIIQPTCGPDVNRSFMELLLLIHTLKLSSAKRITAVIPYFGYARQDRKTKPRVPISASAVSQLIESMGPNRVVTLDLHCGQIQGFFHSTPVDNLFATKEMLKWLRAKNYPNDKIAIVSPDAGGVARARHIADRINAHSVVTILKRRAAANTIESMQVVGDVTDLICVIVDDMIDTAGTLTGAAKLLQEKGAQKVLAFATHGVFSGSAMDRINQSVLEEVCVTDTIPQHERVLSCPKLSVLSVVPLLAEAILRLHNEKSLSILFEDKNLAEKTN